MAPFFTWERQEATMSKDDTVTGSGLDPAAEEVQRAAWEVAWVAPTRKPEPASFVIAFEDKEKLRNIAKRLFSGDRVDEEERHDMATAIHAILDSGMNLSDEDIERLFPGGE
jgi:hypothetical protein